MKTMMMYILIGHSGEYDDYHAELIAVSADKAALEERTEELQREYAESTVNRNLVLEFIKGWKGPRRQYEFETRKMKPKLPSGMKQSEIPQHIFVERAEATAFNVAIDQRYAQFVVAEEAMMKTAALEFLTISGASNPEFVFNTRHSYSGETTYVIEEIDVL